MKYTFTRRNGSRFTMDITIDQEKLADHMARKNTRRGAMASKVTIATGAIVATFEELPS